MTPSERLQYRLLTSGLSYYVMARAGFRMQLTPETGVVYHHALEYLMKVHLAKTRSDDELRKQFNHCLDRIWQAFKMDFPDQQLEKFDHVVAEVSRFEDLRYPDDNGMQVQFDWTRPAPSAQATASGNLPQYHLYIHEIDRLVVKLFQANGYNPKVILGSAHPLAREAIDTNNPVAHQLLP
jgi:hypothetical protein